jgi:hypothetical protein
MFGSWQESAGDKDAFFKPSLIFFCNSSPSPVVGQQDFHRDGSEILSGETPSSAAGTIAVLILSYHVDQAM